MALAGWMSCWVAAGSWHPTRWRGWWSTRCSPTALVAWPTISPWCAWTGAGQRRDCAGEHTGVQGSPPLPYGRGRGSGGCAGDDQLVDRRGRPPQLARPPQQLADPTVGSRQGEALEALAGRVEPDQRVGGEVAQPHHVAVIDVHRIRLRALAGQRPLPPAPGGRVVAAQPAGVPL